jgi:hypothetical protein
MVLERIQIGEGALRRKERRRGAPLTRPFSLNTEMPSPARGEGTSGNRHACGLQGPIAT